MNLGRNRDTRELWLLVLLTLVTRAWFVYRSGSPEPDATAMIAGMALGMNGNVSLGDALLYGRNVNPGMHWLVIHLFPVLHVSATHLLPVLNGLSVVCASLLVLPLYTLLRTRLSHRATIGCLIVWVTTPLVWESGTYYHPLIPATLLLLTAILCARRIDGTPRGLLWSILTLVLGCAAFVLRVELVIVWPAFAVWTMTSRKPVRNTSIMVALCTAAALAYIAFTRNIAGTTSGTSLGVPGFLHLLRGMYLHGVNLRALPRSITWMACGAGVATVAVCAVGWLPGRGSVAPRRGRFAAVAIAWAVPSILFWLPQPVPILRHYFLASIGLVALLGVLVLDRIPERRWFWGCAIIVVVNLLVPEMAYRAYNATAAAHKTPHGAFFYYHSDALHRIDRDNEVARRIVGCGANAGTPAKSCALVQWEELAHVAYVVAIGSSIVAPEPVETIFPGVRYVRFRVGEGEVRLIHYVYFEDDSLRTIGAHIMRASHDAGFCLFAPRTLCERTPQLQALPDLQCY